MTGKAGLGWVRPVTAVNRTAPKAALAATVIRSPMAAKRQYCRERRNGMPAASSVRAPRGRVQSGSHAGPEGSASQRAAGTDRAARPPSRATLMAIRSRERAATMRRGIARVGRGG